MEIYQGVMEKEEGVVEEEEASVLNSVIAVLHSTAQGRQQLGPLPGHVEPGRLGHDHCQLNCDLVDGLSHSLH